MSPAKESWAKPGDLVPRTWDASCERKSEVSPNAAIVVQKTTRVEKRGDSTARRKYSITVRGEIPLNLADRISSIYASAVLLTRHRDLATPPASQRQGSSVTNKRRRNSHNQSTI